MDLEMINLPTDQSFTFLGSTIDSRGGRSQRRGGEQSGKGMVEMERTEWSDLRQESSNENETPDIPDSDSTDVALLLRIMANVC